MDSSFSCDAYGFLYLKKYSFAKSGFSLWNALSWLTWGGFKCIAFENTNCCSPQPVWRACGWPPPCSAAPTAAPGCGCWSVPVSVWQTLSTLLQDRKRQSIQSAAKRFHWRMLFHSASSNMMETLWEYITEIPIHWFNHLWNILVVIGSKQMLLKCFCVNRGIRRSCAFWYCTSPKCGVNTVYSCSRQYNMI